MSATMMGFLGLCLVITLTPGLDTAVVLRVALRHGGEVGVRTALGCALGLFVHAVVVALGLATILLRSQTVFDVLRLVGAGLLIVIGTVSLVQAVRAGRTGGAAASSAGGVLSPAGTAPSAGGDAVGERDDAPGENTRFLGMSPFLQGLLTNLTNPKATLFFLSALPQFVPAGSPRTALGTALTLAVIAACFSAVGLGLVSVLAGRARVVLRTVMARRIQEGLFGAVLVGLGVKVALEH